MARKCIVCGQGPVPDEDYKARLGEICPTCKWQVDDIEDNGYSWMNKSTLIDFYNKYHNNK